MSARRSRARTTSVIADARSESAASLRGCPPAPGSLATRLASTYVATGSNPSRAYDATAAALSARTLRAIVSIPSASRSRQSAAHAPRARPCPRSSGSVATLPSAATPQVGEWTCTPATQTSRPSSPDRRRTVRSPASAARTTCQDTPHRRTPRSRPGRRRRGGRRGARARRGGRSRPSASFRCGSAPSIAYRSREGVEQRRRRMHVERGRERVAHRPQEILHRRDAAPPRSRAGRAPTAPCRAARAPPGARRAPSRTTGCDGQSKSSRSPSSYTWARALRRRNAAISSLSCELDDGHRSRERSGASSAGPVRAGLSRRRRRRPGGPRRAS